MYTYKKITTMISIVALVGTMMGEPAVENYDSGQKRILALMEHEKTGFNAQMSDCSYAQTQNLATDLNIKEMAEFFNCKTIAGNRYLEELLKRPLASASRDTILIQRQHIIRTLVENPTLKQEIDDLLVQAKQ